MSQTVINRMFTSGISKVFLGMFTSAMLLVACSENISPERALVVSIYDYDYFPGDTVDYRVHNMSGRDVAYDTCSEPALQTRDTSNAWINVPISPPAEPSEEDEECTGGLVPITPWKSLSFAYPLPFTLKAGEYRLVVKSGEPVNDTDSELRRHITASPPFTVRASAPRD